MHECPDIWPPADGVVILRTGAKVELGATDGLHTQDRDTLHRLGELLYDIAAGRLATRDALLPLVRTLMIYTRDDRSPEGAEHVVDRLLAIADNWYGAGVMAEAALSVIKGWRR
jgi:hypothetical protein